MLPKIGTNLRCDDHFVGGGMYEPQEHGVNDDLYGGHGPHHTQVIHHQEPVRCQVSVSEIMDENINNCVSEIMGGKHKKLWV